MSPLLGHRPSPAMVVALALFIALAGTSYPAIKLPANSVGTKTIKNGAIHRADLAANAVDSARVADHTLLAGDFKAGQLPSGLPGPAGPKGDAGRPRTLWSARRPGTASSAPTASLARSRPVAGRIAPTAT
jgi:hypothetical protein